MHRGASNRKRRSGRAPYERDEQLVAYGAAVRDARNARGQTQIRVAGLIGITQAALSKIERGDRLPTQPTRTAIRQVLGAEVDARFPRARRTAPRPTPRTTAAEPDEPTTRAAVAA